MNGFAAKSAGIIVVHAEETGKVVLPVRFACLCCEVLFREFSLAAALSPATIDLVLMPQGLHNTPAELRRRVQEEIDRLENGPAYVHAENTEAIPPPRYDAILLGYALCSNGVVGLSSQRLPLVIPRGHDCITILLGSKERYREYFDTHHGVYWYSSGWIERTLQPGRERRELTLQRYTKLYGEDNAEYLMEMEQNWYTEYEWATYINWELPTAERDRQFTRACAEYLGWNFDEVQADRQLIYDFLGGQWDSARFLTVQPGECIEPSHDVDILKACAGCACHGALQMDATAATANTLRR
jgi:hypothetical protein